MAAPATEPELTTIDSLPIEMLTEVLLRLPTPAALVHAEVVKRSWRDAIANDKFLDLYRERHKSLPFLGLYVPRQLGGPPSFQMLDSIRFAQDDDRDLSDAALMAFDFGQIRRYQDHRLHDAAFILGTLTLHQDCRLLDCHNGRLLLTRGNEALEVRSPVGRDSILVPFPPDADYLEACCLLQGHDRSAFRVVYLQHRRQGRNRRQARAVEYDSRRKSWQDYPWETLKSNVRGTPQEVMHAGHRIFCTYTGLTSAALLLDASNMHFSILPFPSDKHFVIGEIEDSVCCFLQSDGCADHRLRMWQLDDDKLVWDLKKDIKMCQVLGEHVGYYRPRAISNGTALLCSSTTHHHFVVDLNTWSIKDRFEFQGQFAYPMQMPWPAFSSPSPIVEGSVSEPFSQQDKHDHTAAVEPKSCRQKSPNNLPHRANGEGADDGGSSNQSSKVSSDEGLSAHATVTTGFDRISDVLLTDAFEPGHLPECITTQDTAMISQPDSRKAHLTALQHERGEKVNQDLEDVCASIRTVEKDHAHGDLTLQTVQTAPVSQNCNVTLHDKTSEANCFSEKKNKKNRTDVQKDNCRTSIPSSSKDRDRESAKKTSNEEKPEDTSPEIGVRSKDQDISDTLEGLSQEDLCIKCGKDGELLTCSDCLLAAHGSCFGSSVTFEGTNLFYCPVCLHKRARETYLKEKKTYCEARKNAVAFLARAQVSKQHDEQLNGVQPGAANRHGHSNGCDTSKRNSIHQNEAHNLAHRDEEPHQTRNKQKMNARGNGYLEEVLAENVPFQNPGPASMNKHSVLQNNSKTRVEGPEKKQQAGDKEACKEAGDDNSSSDKTRASFQICDPSLNQDSEADQEDSLAAYNQTGGSDEIEATSSNDPGKQSSPPLRNMRHGKKRLHEEESAVPSISIKGTAKQG